VLVHGSPQLTRDIDITLGDGFGPLNALAGAHAGSRMKPLVDPDTFPRETMVLPCRDPLTTIRVDFIFSFSPTNARSLARVRLVTIGRSREVRSPEDLIIHKVIAGRALDLRYTRSVLIRTPRSISITFGMARTVHVRPARTLPAAIQ